MGGAGSTRNTTPAATASGSGMGGARSTIRLECKRAGGTFVKEVPLTATELDRA